MVWIIFLYSFINYYYCWCQYGLQRLINIKKYYSIPYKSFDHAIAAFFATYFAIHGYAKIHDYLLGVLTNRGKVVREKYGSNRMYLRFTSSDEEQIELIRAFIPWSTDYLTKKTKPTMYLRCHDDELIWKMTKKTTHSAWMSIRRVFERSETSYTRMSACIIMS